MKNDLKNLIFLNTKRGLPENAYLLLINPSFIITMKKVMTCLHLVKCVSQMIRTHFSDDSKKVRFNEEKNL